MNDDRTSIFSHPDFNCRPWNYTKSAMQKTLHRSRAEESLVNHSSQCVLKTLATYNSITAGRDFHPAPKMNQYFLFYNFTIMNY